MGVWFGCAAADIGCGASLGLVVVLVRVGGISIGGGSGPATRKLCLLPSENSLIADDWGKRVPSIIPTFDGSVVQCRWNQAVGIVAY